MARPRAFTALQPTGELHLGNYLGALRPWVRRQRDLSGFFAVADLHALTGAPDPERLRERSRQVAALCLAAGVDPQETNLFLQSQVPAHAELAWILACSCPTGWLQRMIQFRERAAARRETPAAGLLLYPVLMAADILLYDAELVPVGEDQLQHLELCRLLARRFGQRYGGGLRLPRASLELTGARVMGLDDPTRKMSKSAPSPHHRIGLLDPPERVRLALERAVTDSGHEVAFDPIGKPGVSNLLGILAALSGESPQGAAARLAGRGYGALKAEVAERVVAELEPIQARYAALVADDADLDAVLAAGARRAREVAAATLGRVREATGLLPARA